jgi:SAM-dependent methyltransferase
MSSTRTPFWPRRVAEWTPPTETTLPPEFGPLIGDKRHVRILDLGAGAFPCVGSTWPGVSVDMVRADADAPAYYDLWARRGMAPPEPIEPQDMRALTYLDESFDIVYCSNALDHCEDPLPAVREMVRVCRPGGWLYLYHGEKEGTRRRYTGQHRWNLSLTPTGDCIVWSHRRPGKGFHLTPLFPSFRHERVQGATHHYIRSLGQK